MIVKKAGTYWLLRDLGIRNLTTTGTLPAGSEVRITQVDEGGQKVIGPEILDWRHWDLPVVPSVDQRAR